MVALAVACGSNAPLPTKVVSSGAAGSTGSGTGRAGETASGAAGAGSAASAGNAASASVGTGGTGSVDTAGVGAAGASAAGAAGTVAVGVMGQAGSFSLPGTMCGSPTLSSGMCVAGAYKRNGAGCQCQDALPCVCGQGCVQPLTDDDNCGACGVHCGPTSTCNAGVCGPPVVNVVPTAPGCGALDLTIVGDVLFWADAGHGTVNRLSLLDGGTTIISSSEQAPAKITVGGSSVFWISAGKTIRRSDAGGPPVDVVSIGDPIGGLLASADSVYFSSGMVVQRVPWTGGTPLVVAQELLGMPRAIAFWGNGIVYPNDVTGDVDLVTLVDGKIASCSTNPMTGDFVGVGCTRLARSQGELYTDAIISVPGLVVWGDGMNVKLEPLPGMGTFSLVAMTNSNPVSGLAATAKTAYFAEDSSAPAARDGGIFKSALLPEQLAARIARGQNGPRSLALGPTMVYWSTADCTIESTRQ
jgi:hypothetical protein